MPNTKRLLLALPFALLLLTVCTTTPNDFKDHTPKLDLFEYFQGQTKAWGLFEDRFGKVRRQFQVDIQGTVADGTLTLDESFRYDDGELARRVWTIRSDGPDHAGPGRRRGRRGPRPGRRKCPELDLHHGPAGGRLHLAGGLRRLDVPATRRGS